VRYGDVRHVGKSNISRREMELRVLKDRLTLLISNLLHRTINSWSSVTQVHKKTVVFIEKYGD
jgi:hypothetical protein